MEKENNRPEVCRHYWKIESPKGTKSRGVCKLCGEIREFGNSIDRGPSRSELARQSLENKSLGPEATEQNAVELR